MSATRYGGDDGDDDDKLLIYDDDDKLLIIYINPNGAINHIAICMIYQLLHERSPVWLVQNYIVCVE